MGKEWTEAPLGDVAELSWGDTKTTKASYTETGWLAYSASGPDGYLPHHDHDEPAVVISAIGALCGKTWLATGLWSCIKNTMWMRGDGVAADTSFLFQLTRQPAFWPRRGAAQPFISLEDARATVVRLPPLRRQREIASALGAFDRLIEVNQRQIELLEQLARSLYREWFVRFRFPGHAGAEFSSSALGSLPSRWQTSTLGSVATITMGQSPKSKYYNEAGEGLPFHQGVKGYGALLPTHHTYCTAEMRIAEPGDVLCSVRAPVGRLNLADRRLGIGRGLSAIRRTDGSRAFLLLQLRHALGEEDAIGGGTIYKAVNRTQLVDLPVLEPEPELVSRFELIAQPMLDERIALTLQNQQITAARDLLLPRLVSGQLDVSEVDLGALAPGEPE